MVLLFTVNTVHSETSAGNVGRGMHVPRCEPSLATRVWRPPGSDPEDLLLLSLELLLADYALVTKLGEPLQLGHVLRLGGRRPNVLGLFLVGEVLSHSHPALDRRAASLHTRLDDHPLVRDVHVEDLAGEVQRL